LPSPAFLLIDLTGAIMRKKIGLRQAAEIYNTCKGLSGTELTEAVDRALKLAESRGGAIDLHVGDTYLVARPEGGNVDFDEDAFYDALRKMGCNK
jgi:hypothetical protein